MQDRLMHAQSKMEELYLASLETKLYVVQFFKQTKYFLQNSLLIKTISTLIISIIFGLIWPQLLCN